MNSVVANTEQKCATCDYVPVGRKPDGWCCGVCRAARRAEKREIEIVLLMTRIEALVPGGMMVYAEGEGGNRKPEIEHFPGEDLPFHLYMHLDEQGYATAREAAERAWSEGDDGEPYGWTGLGNGFE